MIIAKDYRDIIKEAFKFSTGQSFCQIATIKKNNNIIEPKARTVRLYLEEERNALRFTCSTQTNKWAELKAIPKVTGIYLDQTTFTQYRFEADAILIDKTIAAEKSLYIASWLALRPDLRDSLWQEYLADANMHYSIDEVFPCHGNVLLNPYYWDILKVNFDDHTKSERTQMILKDGLWNVFEKAPNICPLKLI